MAQPVHGVAGDQAQAVGQGFQRSRHLQQMADIVPVDHHPVQDREFRDRRSQQSQRLPERSAIEWQRFQRAATGSRAFQLKKIIRMEGPGAKPHRRFFFQTADRFRPDAQERVPHRLRCPVAHGGIEKRGRPLRTVLCANLKGMPGVRNPDGACGQRRGASDELRTLDQNGPGAFQCSEDCRRHPCRPAAEHNNVPLCRLMFYVREFRVGHGARSSCWRVGHGPIIEGLDSKHDSKLETLSIFHLYRCNLPPQPR